MDTLSTSRVQELKNKHQCIQADSPYTTAEIDRRISSIENRPAETESEGLYGSRLQSRTKPTSGLGPNENIGLFSPRALDLQSSSLDFARSSSAPGAVRPPADITADSGPNWQHANDKQKLDAESESGPKSDAIGTLANGDQCNGADFEELVDRLLSQAMSKTDARFTAIFLCLYRQFSTPSVLLAAIVSRFENVDLRTSPQAMRLMTQLRYLSVLATWVSEYPGDFAHPLIRAQMTGFISALGNRRQFSMATKEISLHFDVVAEDDDTYWAYSDATRDMTGTAESLWTMSSAQNISPTTAAEPVTLGAAQDAYSHVKGSDATKRGSATPSTASSVGKSSSRSNASFQALLKSDESAQAQARLLASSHRASMSKVHWHCFMEVPDEDIALELTRIDWTLFSMIRPRDLVRHVSLCEEDKERCKNLQNVRRMIDQFNHTAFWIANVILLREKPKYRARALEKCMAIAWVSEAP